MPVLTALGSAIPLAFASGLNVYATIAVIGISSRYGLVTLPDQFRAFDNPIIIGVAVGLYLVEFIADKIPWLDSLWDMVHTVIRPFGGALLAVMALGNASPLARALAALLGGSVAMTTHVTKAGTRVAANASPEPFSNWLLSLGEDLLTVTLSYTALRSPRIALAIAVALLLVVLAFASFIIRALRRRFFPPRAAA
ncbi:MAG TPA: DUF4126 domain-containing protein [Vicinamibacterales bacterium]|nr:DUF4126 domain-containing protein [Vicinamibacterales bacterium]